MVPLHFAISDISAMTFYREIIAIVFLGMIVISLLEKGTLKLEMRRELFYFLAFPSILLLAAFYDPMRSLYNSSDLAGITSSGLDIDPRIYILRNAFLYVPLVIYLSMRGITKEELKNIAIVAILIAPFSILSYLLKVYNEGTLSLLLLSNMAELGGANIEYNSYVPYLTFPFICATYLLSLRVGSFFKVICFFSLSIMSIFIFLSSSRQSMLLIFIAAFLFFNFDSISKTKKILIYSLAALTLFAIYSYITLDVQINQNLISKYSSGAESNRLLIWQKGLSLLEWHEYLIGAGLSSVVASGPHNDYIRWTQRVGLLLMFLSFLPYIIALIKSSINATMKENRTHYIFISLLLLFTLYHSLFGYPREDVYQSVYCFLGLGIWLGFNKGLVLKR
jgi:hypothetical protein